MKKTTGLNAEEALTKLSGEQALAKLRQAAAGLKAGSAVEHPAHYTSHPSGIECIEVAEHMNFNLGNAMKYLWRHDRKNGIEDLRKAKWYLEREIERLAFTKTKAC